MQKADRSCHSLPWHVHQVSDAVRLQLNALRDLHVPRQNHGVQVGTFIEPAEFGSFVMRVLHVSSCRDAISGVVCDLFGAPDRMRMCHPFIVAAQVAYEFAVEAGWMERSRYFGYSTDMYHFDHFMGKALGEFAPMIDAQSYEILEPQLREDGRTNVEVAVTSKTGDVSMWTFIMVKRTFGKYKDCWCTHRLLRSDSKWINDV